MRARNATLRKERSRSPSDFGLAPVSSSGTVSIFYIFWHRLFSSDRTGQVGKTDRTGSPLRHFRLEPPSNDSLCVEQVRRCMHHRTTQCCSRTAPTFSLNAHSGSLMNRNGKALSLSFFDQPEVIRKSINTWLPRSPPRDGFEDETQPRRMEGKIGQGARRRQPRFAAAPIANSQE